MTTYKNLIEMVITREASILGKNRLLPVLKESGIEVNDKLELVGEEFTIKNLETLIHKLDDSYGAVAVMGCKMALIRLSRESNLELPKILL